jgi:hypothetical protein
MRRLVVLLAAAVLGAWLASPALSSRPYVPRAVEFAQAIPASAGDGGVDGWRSAIVRAPARFDLVGLSLDPPRIVDESLLPARSRVDRRRTRRVDPFESRRSALGRDRRRGFAARRGGSRLSWRTPAGHGDARIRVRDASSGDWSAWVAMAHDHGGAIRGTEPVWAGGADALQVRLSRRPLGLRAQFVNATGSATPVARALTALRRAAHGALAAIAGTSARAQSGAGGGAPPIVPREAWGAEQCGPPRAAPSYGSVQAAFVHHTVDANEYAPQDSAAIVLAICRYHRVTKGWRDIGYNFLVDRYGVIFEGRAGGVEQPVIGAQAQGYNGASTGVANIGTFGALAQTPQAVEATARLLAWKLSLHGVPVQGQVTISSGGGASNRYAAGTPVTFERISGHRDADSTSCPGDALYGQLAQIRARAAELAPALAPSAAAGAVTLDAADTTLDYPQAAQLSGRAADDAGAPLAGAPISIQIVAAARYETLARTTTGADGAWSAQLPTQYTRRLRAVVRLPGGGLAASRTVAVAVAPRIGVRAPRRVTARRAFTLRGSVRPRRSGLTLVIARQGRDGAMHTVARVPLRAVRGTVRHKLRLRRPALHRLRIESRGDVRNRAGRSRDVYLRAVAPRR